MAIMYQDRRHAFLALITEERAKHSNWQKQVAFERFRYSERARDYQFEAALISTIWCMLISIANKLHWHMKTRRTDLRARKFHGVFSTVRIPHNSMQCMRR
jgi:hypothetical protein